MNRRQFIKGSAIGAGALALSSQVGAERSGAAVATNKKTQFRVAGQFLIAHGVGYRLPVVSPHLSAYSVVKAGGDGPAEVQYFGTAIDEVHYGFRPKYSHNPSRETWLLGYSSGGKIEVVDERFQTKKMLDIKDTVFRGHAVDYKEGVLLSCIQRSAHTFLQQPAADNEHGYLIHLASDGTLVKKAEIQGVLPHHIIDCGNFFAVSDYGFTGDGGSKELRDYEQKTGGDPLMYRVSRPGVCIVDKETLKPLRYVRLPAYGFVTHLAQDHKGMVLALMANTRLSSVNPQGVYAYAKRDGASLLESEINSNQYLEPFPIFQIDPADGSVSMITLPAHLSRRAHDIVFNPVSGHTVAVFSASDRIWVRYPDGREKLLDTVSLGITEPRGICVIPDTPYVALAGQQSNIAILNCDLDEPLIKLYRVRLGVQSHLSWLQA